MIRNELAVFIMGRKNFLQIVLGSRSDLSWLKLLNLSRFYYQYIKTPLVEKLRLLITFWGGIIDMTFYFGRKRSGKVHNNNERTS